MTLFDKTPYDDLERTDDSADIPFEDTPSSREQSDAERFFDWVGWHDEASTPHPVVQPDGSISLTLPNRRSAVIEDFHKLSLVDGNWVWEMCRSIGGRRQFIVRQ